MCNTNFGEDLDSFGGKQKKNRKIVGNQAKPRKSVDIGIGVKLQTKLLIQKTKEKNGSRVRLRLSHVLSGTFCFPLLWNSNFGKQAKKKRGKLCENWSKYVGANQITEALDFCDSHHRALTPVLGVYSASQLYLPRESKWLCLTLNGHRSESHMGLVRQRSVNTELLSQTQPGLGFLFLPNSFAFLGISYSEQC